MALVLNKFLTMELEGYEPIPMHDTCLQEMAHRVAQVDAEFAEHQLTADQLDKDSKDILASITCEIEQEIDTLKPPSNVQLERQARASKKWLEYKKNMWVAKEKASKWSVISANMHALQEALRSEYSKWGRG